MRLRKTDAVSTLLAALVIAAGALWIHQRWPEQLHAGRAQMLARLLATSHAPRMTEAPGVEAWLLSLLQDTGADATQLQPSAAPRLPPAMQDVAERLRSPSTSTTIASAPLDAPVVEATATGPAADGPRRRSLRSVGHVQLRGHTLVLTRRESLFEVGPLPTDLSHAAHHLVALAEAWPQDAGAEGRPIRLYSIAEDGSYISVPFPEGDRSPDALARAVADETVQSQRRPRAPSLVTDSVFLEFDYAEPLPSQAHYSGVYTDVAGSGFVASVSVPVVYERGGLKMVIAADLAVNLPLDRLVAAADPAMQLALTGPVRELRTPMWQPWTTVGASLPPDAPDALRRQVQERASTEAKEDIWMPQRSMVHHTPSDGTGVLLALQVSRRQWLVGWIVETPAPIPWVPLLLAPALLLGLLAWARWHNRTLERERDSATAELRERDGVLDLLELPLVVVDPNDDSVVHANQAATELGVTAGRVFHEHLIATDSRSQEHYQTMQLAEGGRRRAYGVHLRDGVREAKPRGGFALIRSVSLTQAQPGLHAAAHHRVGLVCVVEDDADLRHYLADHVADARQDERNRLAALINHGADTLARVLANRLAADTDHALSEWLAQYLLRRLHVSQWILDHWGGPVCHDVDCILGPEHVKRAIAQYERIFTIVGNDPALRAQLHWNNGTLSAPASDGTARLEPWIDWPSDYRLTMPTEGLFGYALGEAITNAIKHGAPGRPITLQIELDRGRRELSLTLRNETLLSQEPSHKTKAYGGLAITKELARMCGWAMRTQHDAESFEICWTCPVTQQHPHGHVD